MKTPEEWRNIVLNNPTVSIKSLVSQVQKEAWNEAIKAAVETMNNQETLKLPQQSILKLLK